MTAAHDPAEVLREVAWAIHEAECEAYKHEGRNAKCERSARAVLTALAPAFAEARAEAWDEGYDLGFSDGHGEGTGQGDAEAVNPYRDLAATHGEADS